jgi:hypothetical protein
MSEMFPEGREFAFQLLFFRDSDWRQLVRIDNQMHRGRPGVHVHKGGRVIWQHMTLSEAERYMEDLVTR